MRQRPKQKSVHVTRPPLLQELKELTGERSEQAAANRAFEIAAAVLRATPDAVVVSSAKINETMRRRTFDIAVQHAALIAKHFGIEGDVTGDPATESIAVHSGGKTLVIAPPTAARGAN